METENKYEKAFNFISHWEMQINIIKQIPQYTLQNG